MKEVTWHHHQVPGKMELVLEDIHGAVNHIGGNK
ncbi:HNH endonuclease [Bacillus wiedmannii]|nr:HNH endonuclease [Bacillus wiedmannii]MED3318184.1 HNH endonuclease [Bacillus wiedmannii]